VRPRVDRLRRALSELDAKRGRLVSLRSFGPDFERVGRGQWVQRRDFSEYMTLSREAGSVRRKLEAGG
jgi:hypothetical protein